METVEQWQTTIQELAEKRAKHVAKVETLQEERKPLQLSAATGDKEAARALDRIRQQLVTSELELGDLDGALAAAQEKLAEAQGHARRLQYQLKAVDLEALQQELLEANKTIDEMLDALGQRLAARKDIIARANAAQAPELRKRVEDVPYVSLIAGMMTYHGCAMLRTGADNTRSIPYQKPLAETDHALTHMANAAHQHRLASEA